MAITTNRIICVLNLPLRVPDLVTYGESVVTAMTNNSHFVTVTPALATVAAALTALRTAETATQTRAKGTIPARNSARANVVQLLHELKAYVQSIADASPDDAETIIVSAGMQAKKPPVRIKPDFAAKPGPISGTAKLSVRSAGRRSSYEWEWSSDGGKTWTATAPSLQARTTMTGLPVATSVEFRYRPTTKAGPGDWSQVLTYVVK